MRFMWTQESSGNFWLAPATLGVLLILLGGLLYVMPELLAYFVAGIFVLAGCTLLVTAWRMRRRVSYRPVDRQWQVHQPPDDSTGA